MDETELVQEVAEIVTQSLAHAYSLSARLAQEGKPGVSFEDIGTLAATAVITHLDAQYAARVAGAAEEVKAIYTISERQDGGPGRWCVGEHASRALALLCADAAAHPCPRPTRQEVEAFLRQQQEVQDARFEALERERRKALDELASRGPGVQMRADAAEHPKGESLDLERDVRPVVMGEEAT
jgi:hypothetical protein